MTDQASTVGVKLPEGTVLIVLDAGGLALARKLQGVLPGASVHGLAGRVEGADKTFTDTIRHVQDLFAAGRPLAGMCASGILIRALAPLLGDKWLEPPVVAVAGDGSAAVPLLGGHRGANALAQVIATETGGTAALTTAGDLRFGLALDDPPPGWRVHNPVAAKAVTAALLAGETVELTVEAGEDRWLTQSGAPFAEQGEVSAGEVSVIVTDKITDGNGRTLVLHPPVLALGVGCERGTQPEELIALAEQTLAGGGLNARAVACVVSLDLKADEAAVHALARHLDVPARFFDAARLEKESPRLVNPSEAVFAEVGCHGVAEGAALAAAGADGALIVPKNKSKRATCAVGRSAADINPVDIGQPQGKLTIVGIGPGQDAWRTPAATAALREASDIVGYGLYLDLIADVIAGKARHQSELAEEETRVRAALDLAARGRTVALVSSGDAGIYALAALAFELLDRENKDDWNRLDISVTPGISALQAAASRIGAPLGHDFCTVSLSDLLTPWDEIERRLKAAADGDFIIALYNPVSKRRRTQLVAARDILLSGRPPTTPVVLARNLGRDGETVDVISLEELTPDHADMLTLVLIGNGQTRLIERGVGRWVYTPRGYAKKMEKNP
ncbi:MAG: precorrin-3B C(17)-methyltransferase [Rhodospirillales bacterium]|nr:precorrin-3B C(17)-methyltransferase [Rhodospirillales bacterium]